VAAAIVAMAVLAMNHGLLWLIEKAVALAMGA